MPVSMSMAILPLRALLTLIILLWAQSAAAVTYYISNPTNTPEGSDLVNCTQAQSINTPKATWIGLVGAAGKPNCTISPGDIIYFRGGTYIDIDSSTSAMPSGSAGGGYVTISAYQPVGGPIESVTIATTVDRGISIRNNQSYIIFNNLILDGGGSGGAFAFGNFAAHHIKYIGGQIRNTPVSCVNGGINPQTGSTSTDIVISGVEIWNCGSSKFDHGIYMLATNSIIENNNIHDNPGYGIHMYSQEANSNGSNTIIRNNRIHNNNEDEVPQSSDITINNAGTTNVQIYNNFLYNTFNAPSAIVLAVGNNARVYNNTIYNHPGAICIDVYSTGHYIRNNICYIASTTITVQSGGSVTASSNNLATDPDFIDAANGNFGLDVGSDAIDGGLNLSTALSPPENDVLWHVDAAGTDRGAAAAMWDQGALQFVDEGDPEPTLPPAECSAMNFPGTIQPVGCSASRADTTTFAMTEPISTLLANFQIIICGWDSMTAGAEMTPSDSLGNIYTPLTAATILFAKVRYFVVSSPLTGTNVTATCSSGGLDAFPYIAFLALRLTATSPVDQFSSNTATQSTTSLQPGSITPSENNTVIIVAIVISGGCSDFTINGGYSTLVAIDCGTEETQGGGVFFLAQTTAAATNPTVSWTSPAGTEDIAMVIASFKAQSEDADPPLSTNIHRVRRRPN